LLGSAARDLSRAIGLARPLLDILAEPTDAAQQDHHPALAAPAPHNTPPPAVTIEDLHFAYDPQRPLINGLTLHFAAGHTTAIVGPSGSGKSSLVRLLMRLYAPSAGRILLDERPIDEIPAAQLRAQIGLISQETLLLHATIADNIALGMPGASQSEIEQAARGAQLHDVILAMPHGYDTEVGERGMQLSGGERQRVAIARALLRRSLIYVLDEPTSMLDSNTEACILRALRDVTAGRTTIVIAHRLSTVIHADEIIVLDGGQVRERGQHTDLLAQRGLYADLWARQAGKC
jgi:ATP-binding cassette subfamily B protein